MSAMARLTGRNKLAPKTSFGTREKKPTCRGRTSRTSDLSLCPEKNSGLIRLGGARLGLLFGEHFLSRFKLALGARVPGRRIDEGMRIAGLAVGEFLGALVDATARIAVRVLPGMGLDIDLHALHSVHLLGVLHPLLGTGKARRAAPAATPDAAIRLRAVMQSEAFDEQVARRVAWGGVDNEVLIAEVEVIALTHFHVALWHFGRLAALAVVGLAGEGFYHLPVFGHRHDAPAGK